MPDLFDRSDVAAIRARVEQLRPDSVRQWGTMDPAQAAAHCAHGLEIALGDHRPPRMLIGSVIGRLIKPLALGKGDMKRNSPTVPSLRITDERDLTRERQRLLDTIDRFAAAGPAGVTTHPHSFFGRMTPAEWAILMHKHLDHHLRQFGV